jgi:putative hydrolase of the HAD superfamily
MRDKVAVLFLDIGGVLLTNGWDWRARRRAAEAFRLDPEEMNERHHLTFDTYELGKLSLDDYLNRTVFYRERNFSRHEIKEFMYSQSKPHPEMMDLVTRVKKLNNLRIVAVSNEGRELTRHRIETFELDRFIDFFVCSCFVHFRKPDPDIYTLALDVTQVRPEEVVYIDDREMFVHVARGMGIRGIHHEGQDSTRDALQAEGLRVPQG